MSFINLMYIAALGCLLRTMAACRVTGAGCSETIPCCGVLLCQRDPPGSYWGFCQESSTGVVTTALTLPAQTISQTTAAPITTAAPTGPCQPTGTGCSTTILCCSGLVCQKDAPTSYWGFCQQGSGGVVTTAPTQTPAPTALPIATQSPVTSPPGTQPPSSGIVHNGNGTYYDIGVGACGWTNTDSQLVAAVSTTVYGNQANPNTAPICGQCALVTYGENSVKVTIVDKCMGCQPDDIDMSPAAFDHLASQTLGRIRVSWQIVAC